MKKISALTFLLAILLIPAFIFLLSPSQHTSNNLPVQKPSPSLHTVIPTKAEIRNIKEVAGITDTLESPDALNTPTSNSTSANLIRNSSFETETSATPRGWYYLLDSTTGNTFISQEGIRSGNFGLKFAGGSSGNFGIMQPDLKTVPGRTYTISAYIKQINTPSITLRFGLWNEYLNKEGPVKNLSLSSGTKDWTRVSFTAATPGLITDPKNMFPILEIFGLSSGAVYIDDIQLEEGSSLSVYNSAQAKPSAVSDVGDGSLIFSPGGDISPTYTGSGSLGSSTNKFQSLTLSNASIDKDGNLTVNGSEIKGTLTLSGNLSLKSGAVITFPNLSQGILRSDSSGSISASLLDLAGSDITGTLPVGNGGTGATSLTQYGILYGNGTNAISALTPGTSGYILQSNGISSAPSWVPASGGSSAFSAITAGTNTTSAMTIGSGASLTYSGGTATSGVINANQLLGNTWASPGSIGITTANNASFTTLSASGLISANAGLTIASSQNLTLTGVTANNDILYATAGTGVIASSATNTTNLCLISGASAPSWQSCPGGTNYWETSDGTLYPGNSTLDLLLGGTSTSSAKFAFLNVAGATPTASISANSGNNALFIDGLGNIGTTNRQTLTIGNSSTNNTTGNILLNPNGQGFVGIGTTNPTQKLDVTGTIKASGGFSIDSTNYWNTDNAGTLVVNDSIETAKLVLTYNDSTYGLTSATNVPLYIHPASGQNTLITSGLVGINTTSPLAKLDVRGAGTATTPIASLSGSTNFAGLVVDNSGSGDIFTASSSGLSRFVITQNGNVGIGTTIPGTKFEVAGSLSEASIGVESALRLSRGYVNGISYQGGAELALGRWNVENGLAHSRLDFKLVDSAINGSPDATIMTMQSNGNVGIGTTSPTSTLHIVTPNAVNGAGANAAQILQITGGTGGEGSSASSGYPGNPGGNGSIFTFTGGAGGTGGAIITDGIGGAGGNGSIFTFTGGAGGTGGAGATYGGTGGVGSNFTFTGGAGGAGGTSPANWGGAGGAGGTITLQGGAGGAGGVGYQSTGNTGNYGNIILQSTGGLVGIGTTAPLSLLHVGNDADQTITTPYGVTFQHYNSTFGANSIRPYLKKNWNATLEDYLYLGATGNRDNNVEGTLILGGSGKDIIQIGRGHNNGDQLSSTAFVINTNGSVGIGATSPLAKLDVKGAATATSPIASFSGSTTFAGMIVDNSGSGDLFTASSSGLSRFVITQGGSVGIGTTNPSAKLDVVGDIKASTTIGTGIYTQAGLPAAGTAGRIASLSNNNRSLVRDTGTQWVPVNGNVYNVKDFGAKGDNTTDDTAAIQAAIDAAPAGSVVYLPDGFYHITSITIDHYIHLKGGGYANSVLVPTSNADAVKLNIGGSSILYNVIMSDLAIYPLTDRASGAALHLGYIGYATFDNVKIGSSLGGKPYEGVRIDRASNTRFQNLIVTGTVSHGVILQPAGTDNIIVDVQFDAMTDVSANGGSGFYLTNTYGGTASLEGIYFNGVTVYNNTDSGIRMNAAGGTISNIFINKAILDWNLGTTGGGLYVEGNSAVANLMIQDTWSSYNSGYGMYLNSNVTDFQIENGFILTNMKDGVYVSGAIRGIINGNSIFNNSRESSSSIYYGINIAGSASQIDILNNKIYNTTRWTNYQHGVSIGSSASNIQVRDNFLDVNAGIGAISRVPLVNNGSKVRLSGNTFDSTNSNTYFDIGSTASTPSALMNVSGRITGKALTVFNETGDQALFTASSSGITKFG